MKNIKENYIEISIGDKKYFNVETGSTPSTKERDYWNGDIIWVTPKDLGLLKTAYIENSERYITREGLQNSSASLVPTGSIVISTRAPIGYIAIAAKEISFNQGCKALVFKSNQLDSKFTYYSLLTMIDAMQALGKGAIFKELSKGGLESLKITYPSKNGQPDIDKQLKIVDRIEKLFNEIETGISKTNDGLFNAQKIIYGELNKIFSGKLSNNWKKFKLEDVVKITMGQSPPSSTYNQGGEGLPFFQGKADFTEKYAQPRVYCTQPLRVVDKDDVLISVRAPVGAINFAQAKSCIGRGLAGISSKEVNHSYLFNFLQYLEPQWETKSRGSTFKSINRDDIKQLDIPLPIKGGNIDLKEQEKISKRLEGLRSLASKLTGEYEKQINYFDLLKQSSLNYALAGKFAVAAQPVVVVAQKVKVNIFPIQQAIGVIVQSFERGEMIVAKMLYMAQEIFKAPLGIQFTPQNFGPYDAVVKRAITSGISTRNQFFAKKRVGGQEVFAPGAKINNLMKYNYRSTQQVRNFLNDMSSVFQSADSPAIERLATVCKIVQDNKTTDEVVVRTKMQEWKPGKFQDQDVVRALNFIKTKGWDKVLIQ